jgi:hypothetical protein
MAVTIAAPVPKGTDLQLPLTKNTTQASDCRILNQKLPLINNMQAVTMAAPLRAQIWGRQLV